MPRGPVRLCPQRQPQPDGGGRQGQPALAETSDLPGIASWRIPRPVNTGRQSVGQLKTGVGAVKGEGPRRRDPPKEQPT
jgi:hypothetical protein